MRNKIWLQNCNAWKTNEIKRKLFENDIENAPIIHKQRVSRLINSINVPYTYMYWLFIWNERPNCAISLWKYLSINERIETIKKICVSQNKRTKCDSPENQCMERETSTSKISVIVASFEYGFGFYNYLYLLHIFFGLIYSTFGSPWKQNCILTPFMLRITRWN